MDALRRYTQDGFLLCKGAVPVDAITELMEGYRWLVQEVTGRRFDDLHHGDIVEYFNHRHDHESQVYTRIRQYGWLMEFARHPAILRQIRPLLTVPFGVFQKIPFRIDLPFWTQELAYWHQDYTYVKGNIDTITAWIPMQDTRWQLGCLMVMPGSHREGVLEHDLQIGKKFVPSKIFARDVRYIEMDRGDVLLFSSLLLHSSGLNVSNHIRYSLQARYTPLHLPTDPGMGTVYPFLEEP